MRTMKLTTALAAVTMTATMGCTDFLSTGNDPNRPADAGAKQLFVGVQSNIWALYGSDLSRIAAMFTQQALGADGQYIPIYNYGISEQTTNSQQVALYAFGGLVDIRHIKEKSVAAGDTLFLGIAQVQEALIMSLGADIFGDLVYSEALKGGNPPLDGQLAVYNALLQQLDSAIVNINTTIATNAGPGGADLVYWRGNTDDEIRQNQKDGWTRLAHSLKARIYMHMAEVNPANYALALAEAQQGILSPDDDYQANYTGNAGEANLLYQFVWEQRPGLIMPNPFIVNMMDDLDDPRFDTYFSTVIDTSDEGVVDTLYPYSFSFAWYDVPQKIMTADETRLIWAEAAYRGGATGAGGAAATQLAAYRTMNSFPSLGSLSGSALLLNILREKYIALFHQVEPYNDWKRTCYPNIQRVVTSSNIPARLYYDSNERNTNPNIPPPNSQPVRNANDPANTTDPFGAPCLGNGNTGGGG